MVDTPNQIATLVEAESTTKVDEINAALTNFDVAYTDNIDVDCAAGGTITIAAGDFLDNILFRLTGAPAGAFNLDVPDGKRDFHILNTTGQTATVDTVTGGASSHAVLDASAASFVSRGTDLEIMSGTTPGSSIFGRRTEVFTAGNMYYPGTQPAGAIAARELTANQVTVAYIPFDTSTEERAVFGGVPFPNRWDGGAITFQVGYTHAGGQTGGLDGVSWEVSAVSVADNGSWDVAYGTGVNVTLDRATGDAVHITAESGNLTVGGTIADGNVVYFQIARDVVDALDDLDIDAQLLYVRVFWTEDASVDD